MVFHWAAKTRKRPAALAGNRAHGGLIARVNVWTLVAVHFHGHKILINNLGDFGVLVTLTVDHVAPVAPDRADVQKNGLVFRFRARESGISPFVPVDGLVRRRTQVRAGGILQTVFRMRRHEKSFRFTKR